MGGSDRSVPDPADGPVDTRERLLQAAEELVGAGGYAGTGVDAIAARAGVAKTAIYWHFKNKHGLLLAALERQQGAWVSDLQATVAEAGTPAERLDRLLAHVRAGVTNQPGPRTMVLALLLEQGGDDEVRNAIRRVFVNMRAALALGFERSMPALPDGAGDRIAHGFVCFADGLLLDHLTDPDPDRLDAGLGLLRKHVLATIERELLRA